MTPNPCNASADPSDPTQDRPSPSPLRGAQHPRYAPTPRDGRQAMRRKIRSLLVTSSLLAVLVPVAATTPAAAQPVTLRVMTLNILYGGDELDLDTGRWCSDERGCNAALRQIVRTIEAAAPDVVGLQEPINNTRWIADRLGWYA